MIERMEEDSEYLDVNYESEDSFMDIDEHEETQRLVDVETEFTDDIDEDCIDFNRECTMFDEDSDEAQEENNDSHIRNVAENCKFTMLPLEKLSLFFCCSLLCLGSITLADLSLAREHYLGKNRQQKSQFIMDTVLLNTSSTGECCLCIGSAKVCLAAWRATLAIPESTFYNIKKQVTDGKRVVNPSGKTQGMVERKTQIAFVWLKDFTNTFAASMPDSTQLHLPCCLTKSSVYELMKAELMELDEACISLAHFLRIWKNDLRHIAIPKKSRFAECTICALIKKSLGETKDKNVRRGILEQRDRHLWQQKAEREKYYKHQLKAKRKPQKYLSIIMDAMDQSKTMIPHFVKPAKSTDAMWKLKTHLLAAKVHGVGVYGFFDIFQWPHGSNLTITALLNILHMLKDSIPEVLYLQMDNCGRENKNRFVIAFLCLLVEIGIFKKIKLSFLMTGHTHEDIDQIFSRFSVWLNKNDALTKEELMQGFEKSYTPNPTSVLQTAVFNFSEWIMQYICPMTKHSKPHVFKIYNKNGKANIVCKKWSTDKEYIECVGSEKHLINKVPTDSPDLLAPIFNDLQRVKETLPFANPFLNAKQRDWWKNFFIEKEDEELNFQIETPASPFNLSALALYVKKMRYEQAKHSTPVQIPQFLTDEKDLEPVIIGKKPSRTEKKNTNKYKVGEMVLTDCEKYSDEWPQVGQITDIHATTITVNWFKGSKWSQWQPCTKPMPGQKGKRMPWLENILETEIWLSDFHLTNKKCLPKHIRDAIDNYDN